MVIPSGGTSPVGTTGFVNAAFELRAQIGAGLMSEPDIIYIPLGTMGTAAGLMLGLKAAGLSSRIIAVRVVNRKIASETNFGKLFRDTNDMLREADPSFPRLELLPGDFTIEHGFLGRRYAQYTRESVDAIENMKESEGITLDGTYTGKTFAALLSDAENGNIRNRTVLFWNTLNSRDFSEAIKQTDYHELPEELHCYFEKDVQPLDRVGYERNR